MTRTSIEIAPFAVPSGTNLVLDTDRPSEGPFVMLQDIDSDALDALASTWLGNIYTAVGRSPPFRFIGEQP